MEHMMRCGVDSDQSCQITVLIYFGTHKHPVLNAKLHILNMCTGLS
jgi:hypothetical protein